MSIQEEGFLSPDIIRFIREHRQKCEAAFRLAGALNRTAQHLLLTSEAPVDGDGLNATNIAQLLFVRALSNFQGAILMAERGAVVEARTLARTCLETVFALAAAVSMEDGFIDRVVANEMGSKSKGANWLLNQPQLTIKIEPGAQSELKSFVDRLKQEAEPTGSFATEEMARNGGLDGLYVLFRQLSSDAAHPLLEALNRYVDDGQGGLRAEILWGPVCGADEIEDTVTMACCFLLVGAVTLNMACPVLGVGDQLGDHFDTYKSLLSSASAQGRS
ncbi:DUF5677 domain-containing protein [Brevundimonas sp. DWR2-3-1b1]|uniref:DUF5677 domain-containing protein n=1 Tax=Brevundimonas TaxID=41275 RepID=UPI003CF27B9E